MNILKYTKISHLLALIALVFSSAVFFLFLFWWIYPYKPLVVKQPYQIVNEESSLKQGDVLKYQIDYCKYTNIQSIVRRQFVDGIIYATPEITANLKKGCGLAINTITIPENLPPGTYYLTIEVTYKINPIREISYDLKTEKFVVTKK